MDLRGVTKWREFDAEKAGINHLFLSLTFPSHIPREAIPVPKQTADESPKPRVNQIDKGPDTKYLGPGKDYCAGQLRIYEV